MCPAACEVRFFVSRFDLVLFLYPNTSQSSSRPSRPYSKVLWASCGLRVESLEAHSRSSQEDQGMATGTNTTFSIVLSGSVSFGGAPEVSQPLKFTPCPQALWVCEEPDTTNPKVL